MRQGTTKSVVWSVSLTLTAVAFAARSASAQSSRGARGSLCSPSAFAKVMAVDERSLRHQQQIEVDVGAAEGSTITLRRDGSSIRIVRLLDLGETGRSEKSVFVADSLHFLVWVVEQRYERAIEGRRPPTVSSTAQSVFLVC